MASRAGVGSDLVRGRELKARACGERPGRCGASTCTDLYGRRGRVGAPVVLQHEVPHSIEGTAGRRNQYPCRSRSSCRRILGVGRAERKQIFMGDKYESRIMLPLSLSYDHRIIDGAEAARFNNDLKENLGKNFAYKLAV